MNKTETEFSQKPWPAGIATWTKFIAGFGIVFALFQLLGWKLESARGEAGLIIGAVVTGSLLLYDKWLTGESFKTTFIGLGLGIPVSGNIFLSLIPSVLMIAIIPSYIMLSGASWSMYPGWLGLLPGLFAQAGVAEETLFRGYLFRHLRVGRTFLRAAMIASIPFVLAHLILFFTMPFAIALASVLLSAVISFPLAKLFEMGGNTVWSAAVLHFVIQGAVKVVVIEGDTISFPIIWMLASAIVPFVVFLFKASDKDPVNTRN